MLNMTLNIHVKYFCPRIMTVIKIRNISITVTNGEYVKQNVNLKPLFISFVSIIP